MSIQENQIQSAVELIQEQVFNLTPPQRDALKQVLDIAEVRHDYGIR